MKYRLLKEIRDCWARFWISEKHILYIDTEYVLHCISKEKLQQNWEIGNSYGGFINGQYAIIELVSHEILIVNVENGSFVSKLSEFLNFPGEFYNGCYYSSYRFENENMSTFVQFDLKTNQVCKKQKTEFPVVLVLDYTSYLSWTNDKGNEYHPNVVSKINIEQNSITWQYSISDLGPYLEFRSPLEPLEWVERKIYDLYLENGIIFAIISKGIVALDPETGKQLWWVDFNTTEMETVFFDFQPYSLSFADGKIYCRDWHEFLSISMTTGEILLRKEYIGFEVSGKVVENTKNSGLKIHNGKGYFVLDVDAELYLVSMNLETAEVKIETELPDVKDQVHAEDIYFEGNRMYLRDCASFLYVYEVTD